MDPYFGKLAGHSLIYGILSVSSNGVPVSRPAVCECGATSPELRTIADRRAWHREHKADMIDNFVLRGMDDRGREVHL